MEKQSIMTLNYLSSLHFHKDLAATAQLPSFRFSLTRWKEEKKRKRKRKLYDLISNFLSKPSIS